MGTADTRVQRGIDMHSEMSPHERQAWKEIEDWKAGKLQAKDRLPAPVRAALAKSKSAAVGAWDKVPGNDEIAAAMEGAMAGGFRFVNDAAAASLDRERLLKKFASAQPAPSRVEDLRALDLRLIDKKMPNLAMRYSVAAATEGVGAGFVMGAGASAAAVGALPAFGIVAATLVGDTVTLLGTSARASSHYGAYYGYDTRKPPEALFMMSLMGVASASGQAGKQAAMAHVRQVANLLARRATWSDLSQKTMVKVTQRLFASLGEKLTKRKLGQAVPVLGAGIAGGLNYQFVRSASDAAYFLYRERFLVEKYGLDEGADSAEDADIIDVEVITERLIEETGDSDEGRADDNAQDDDNGHA